MDANAFVVLQKFTDSDTSPMFSGMFGDITLGQWQITFNVIPSVTGIDVQSKIAEALGNWDIISVSASSSDGLSYQGIVNAWVASNFTQQDIINAVNADLTNDGFIAGNVTATFIPAQTSGGTQQPSNNGQKITPSNPKPNITYQVIGSTTDGYLVVKGSDGNCYAYDTFSNLLLDQVACNTAVASSGAGLQSVNDFVTQIGSFFGFDKSTSTLGKLGIGAAAGGVVVILAVLLLTKSK